MMRQVSVSTDIDLAVRIDEVPRNGLAAVDEMNRIIFNEERIINSFVRDDLLILVASIGDTPVGFKIGYRENRQVYYSAKGGVLPAYRRRGIARLLMNDMVRRVKEKGYTRFVFDTFPNRHPGMAIMALADGFRLARADYNPTYRDYRLRFELVLTEPEGGSGQNSA